MSEEVANRLLQVTVAQLLLPVGWSGVTNTSLQVLGDVVKRYIEGLGRITSGYAEHANRQMSNLDDLAMTLDHFNINMASMQDFLYQVDHMPFPHDVPQFPVRRCNNKHLHESATPTTALQDSSTMIGENYDDEDDEEVWSPLIPSYFPPLPTKEEAEKDEEDDKESGIHVSDAEDMEVGTEAVTPGEGLVAKGLSGMASCGRRGRTFSTDSDISSEHDDQVMSLVSGGVTMQHGTAAMPIRVVPHRINPNRSSGTVSPVTPHEEDPPSTEIQLDDSSPESDIDVDDETQPPPVTTKKKKDTMTLELSPQESDSGSEKKSSKKQKTSTTSPSSRIVTKSETKETNFGSNKPTVSSQLLTRFTLAKETSQEPAEAAKAVSPETGRLPEPLSPLKLKPESREAKVSLSSLSPLSSDISSPRSPPFGTKSMQLNVEKLPLESPTQRSYKLDSLSMSPIATASTKYQFPPASSANDDPVPLLSPTITTNSEGEDSDNLSLPPATPEKLDKPVELVATKSIKNVSALPPAVSSQPRLTIKELPKPTVDESSLVVSIDRKYITVPRAGGASSKPRKKKPKTTTKSSGPSKSLVVSIPKKHYVQVVTSRQKSKLLQPIAPATVAATVAATVSSKQEHKTKSKAVDVEPLPPTPVSVENTPQPQAPPQSLKLRFRLNSDVVGESSITPGTVSREGTPQPMDWSSGGHTSSHKKKKKHKKEKKKKKKHHDSDSSSDSEGIYSEGNGAREPAIDKTFIAPPVQTTVLPYQPLFPPVAYPQAICPVCKFPDDGRPMIACDLCDRWFHWACVNIVIEPSDGDWFCPECSRDRGSNSSKRKEHKHKKKKKHFHD